ncbi:phosphatase PAP2 family protein [Marinovum algicola]|uniref:phosphatase PAP2 family protein n=1 Tax=Marinovum algicola TaxID=42444 RepID=UPI0024BB7DBF|nr:phosphatase PAP2 family protein [Marinovum algicola]
MNSPENLFRWDPGSRQSAVFVDTRSGLDVAFDVAAETASVTVGGAKLFHTDRPSEAGFTAQVDDIKAAADLRGDRAPEILAQTTDILSFLAMPLSLNLARHKWTIELLQAVMLPVVAVEKALKNGLACRRPQEYDAQIQPMITAPAHSAFPSGHATEAFAIAEVLSLVSGASGDRAAYGEQMTLQAARIAHNRVVAGVHFHVDNICGAALGRSLARMLLHRAGALGGHHCIGVKAQTAALAGAKLSLDDLDAAFSGGTADHYDASEVASVAPAPLLAALFAAAQDEWT